MTPKGKAAMEILKVGGQWCVRLECDSFTGIAKFKYRLMLGGKIVKGYGFKTYCEVENYLTLAGGGTTVSTYYKLREVV